MNAKQWSEHNWKGAAKNARDKARKILRHPAHFHNRRIKRRENPLAVAHYCGTWLAMIEADYCGMLGLRLDQTKIEPQAENPLEKYGCGAGI
jgi:hypothetical protein